MIRFPIWGNDRNTSGELLFDFITEYFWPSPTYKLSHSPLNINEISLNTTLLNPSKQGISPSLLFLICQLATKSEILSKDIFDICTWVPNLLKREMGWVQPFHELLLASWSSSYDNKGRERLFIFWLGNWDNSKVYIYSGTIGIQVCQTWLLLSPSAWEETGIWKISIQLD